MIRKDDAEKAFDAMFTLWATEQGIPTRPESQPSFADFCKWVDRNHFGYYFNFRSTVGTREDVESWFDRHFGQSWRN